MGDAHAKECGTREAESLEQAKHANHEDLKHLHETIAQQWRLLAEVIETGRAHRRPPISNGRDILTAEAKSDATRTARMRGASSTSMIRFWRSTILSSRSARVQRRGSTRIRFWRMTAALPQLARMQKTSGPWMIRSPKLATAPRKSVRVPRALQV